MKKAFGLFIGILLTALLVSIFSLDLDDSLKVMSINIRSATIDDGKNNWNAGRKEMAIDLINEYQPDIIGFQEATDAEYGNEVSDLKDIAGYQWYGVGRDDGKVKGEHEGVLFLTSRFELVDSGDFWISETPNRSNTTFATKDMNPEWDYKNPRIATWVILEDKQTKQRYFVINQHWAVAVDAQVLSANLIREKIKELSHDLPIIVTGDLNMTDQDPGENPTLNPHNVYSILLNGNSGDKNDLKLVDTYRQISPKDSKIDGVSEMTFHEFYGGLFFHDIETDPKDAVYNHRIDYVLTDQNFITKKSEILRDGDHKNLLFPSDHYPVMSTLILKSNL